MAETKPLLVVGGTGFIGSHVVERLASAGTPTRVVSRGGRWPWRRQPEGVECLALDLANPSSDDRLHELVRETPGVINLAGVLLRPGIPVHVYRELHVDGVRRLVEALRASPDRPVRLIHVSTTGVLGPTGPEPLDDDAVPRPTTPYEATKLEGERIALAARGPGIEVVIVRPGLVYGPRDLHLLALYRSIARGTFRLIDGGRARWQPIHVEDVATAIVRAVEDPNCDGDVFHVAGAETVSVADIARRMAGLLGTRIRGPSLPLGLAMAAGALLELGCRPLDISPPLSRSRVRTLTEDRLYRVDRARRALGFSPTRVLDEGLAETVRWYREHGHL